MENVYEQIFIVPTQFAANDAIFHIYFVPRVREDRQFCTPTENGF